MRDKAIIGFGLGGTILAVICCITPLLPTLLGAIGLSGLIAYVYTDAVLFSAVGVFLLIAAFGFWLKQRHG